MDPNVYEFENAAINDEVVLISSEVGDKSQSWKLDDPIAWTPDDVGTDDANNDVKTAIAITPTGPQASQQTAAWIENKSPDADQSDDARLVDEDMVAIALFVAALQYADPAAVLR